MKKFIKSGFWTTKKSGATPKGWLDLTELIKSFIPKTKYKVFTALLTQSGGDNPDIISGNGGTLDVGYTFEIISNPDNYDLTIYGAPNNNAGTKFMCTKSVLNLPYTNSLQIGVNYGAPVATILENTIGNIWFTYNNAGEYYINSSELFVLDKVYISITNNIDVFNFGGFWSIAINPVSTEQLFLTTGMVDGHFDYILNTTPIEIRVYD